MFTEEELKPGLVGVKWWWAGENISISGRSRRIAQLSNMFSARTTRWTEKTDEFERMKGKADTQVGCEVSMGLLSFDSLDEEGGTAAFEGLKGQDSSYSHLNHHHPATSE